MENQFLKACEPSSTPESFGKTVQARLEELEQQKAELKRLAPLTSKILPGSSEAELISFFDRVKLEGEVSALRWLETKYGGQ